MRVDNTWLKESIAVLAGAKCLSTRVDTDGCPVLTFEKRIGNKLVEFEVAVQCDYEGNGPGALVIPELGT